MSWSRRRSIAVTNQLTVPAAKLSTIGSWAFSVSGPQTWNQLPEEITSATFHSVARQCYTVVRATQQVNGKWQFGGYQNSVTPELID